MNLPEEYYAQGHGVGYEAYTQVKISFPFILVSELRMLVISDSEAGAVPPPQTALQLSGSSSHLILPPETQLCPVMT